MVRALDQTEKSVPAYDPVNAPAHYLKSKIAAIDVIEDWGLGFCLGNAVKYINRYPHKGRPLEDLKKARWYLDREIARLETEAKTESPGS